MDCFWQLERFIYRRRNYKKMMRIINYQGVEQLAVFVTEQSEVEMHLSQNKNVIF